MMSVCKWWNGKAFTPPWAFFLAKMSLFLAATEPFLLNELVLIQEFGKNAAE